MDQPILTIKNLSKEYNGNFAVKDLTLNVYSGEIYGFLGKNGAGKTTTIRMIMKLIKPSSGKIKLFGRNIKNLEKEAFNKVAATIEYPGFYLNLTAKENLLYYSKLRDIPEKKVNEMLNFFGLSYASDRLVKNFSLGMKQRLGLSRAMLHEPEFLILDEPTNGLDPAGIHEIRETIIKLNNEKGITILFSSHILSEVEQISKKVGIINNGKLIDEFLLQDFKTNSTSCIEIKTSNVEAALNLLSSSLKLENIDSDDHGTIYLPGNVERSAVINKMLVQNGIDVNHLLVKSETLESRFMRLTGGSN